MRPPPAHRRKRPAEKLVRVGRPLGARPHWRSDRPWCGVRPAICGHCWTSAKFHTLFRSGRALISAVWGFRWRAV